MGYLGKHGPGKTPRMSQGPGGWQGRTAPQTVLELNSAHGLAKPWAERADVQQVLS